MRSRFLTSLALAALFTPLMVTPVAASDSRLGGVEIRAPWTRPAAAGMTGVGYLVIANTGKTPLRLVSAESPAARMVSLHQSVQTNGVSSMRPVTEGLTIAPGAQIALAPGGYHLMLMGLTQAQTAGGKTPLTLVFEGGRRLQVELVVRASAPTPGEQTAPHHH